MPQVHPHVLLQILSSLAPPSLLLCSILKHNIMKSYGAHGKQYNSVSITLSLTLINPVNYPGGCICFFPAPVSPRMGVCVTPNAGIVL